MAPTLVCLLGKNIKFILWVKKKCSYKKNNNNNLIRLMFIFKFFHDFFFIWLFFINLDLTWHLKNAK